MCERGPVRVANLTVYFLGSARRLGAMISSTLSAFPETPIAIADAGIPFGCLVRPLADLGQEPDDEVFAEDIGRCESCGAYINPYCTILRCDWRCALCGHLTPLDKRYTGLSRRDRPPELQDYIMEVDFAGEHPETAASPPIYVALVDASGGEDFLEVVRASLHAALAALPGDALFGLVVFSDTIGAYVLASPRPHVRHIPIPSTGEPLSLADAIGLHRLLAPVGMAADGIASAIETVGRSTDATTQPDFAG